VIALLVLELRVLDLRSAARHAELARKAAQALAAGLLIGVIEETFFRGALVHGHPAQGRRSRCDLLAGRPLCGVHFLKPGALADGHTLDWPAAGRMVLEVFTDAADWRNLDSFVALLLVGVFPAWSVSAPGTSAGASAFTPAGCWLSRSRATSRTATPALRTPS